MKQNWKQNNQTKKIIVNTLNHKMYTKNQKKVTTCNVDKYIPTSIPFKLTNAQKKNCQNYSQRLNKKNSYESIDSR